MKLLRSGEPAPPGGASMSVARLFALARRWYGDRLSPTWRPRAIAESQRILEDCGLTSPFWALSPPA